MFRTSFAALALVAALGSCGYSTADRAISGGAIGAGTGAAGAAITGYDPLTGALIGGALGAAVGGLTDPRDVDLGRPIWR